jgi:hypothetical protein
MTGGEDGPQIKAVLPEKKKRENNSKKRPLKERAFSL